MKKIKFLSTLTVLSLFLVSCGGPKESAKESVSHVKKESINYAEIVLDFADGILNNIPESPVVVETDPERFAFQPILIKNNKKVSLAVSVDSLALAALNGVEIENNCPAVLPRKQYCYVSIFLNRNKQIAESETLVSTDLVLNLDGADFNIPVQGQTTAAIDLDVITQEKIELSRVSVDYGTVHEGDSKTEIIIIKNNSTKQELPINKDLSALTMASETFSSCPVEGFLKRRGACFIALKLSESLAIDNYSESISIAGKSVDLSAVIDEQPVYTSNLEVTYDKAVDNTYNFDNLASNFVITISNDTFENQQLYYDFSPVLTLDGLSGLDYPSAVSIDDGCNNKSVLRKTSCYIKMSFDPERYHFGVTYSKTISFNDEDMVLNFEGTSPCSDPESNLYQPGTKLSADKKSCVPNLGVFDSPDSVYGHAVYQ